MTSVATETFMNNAEDVSLAQKKPKKKPQIQGITHILCQTGYNCQGGARPANRPRPRPGVRKCSRISPGGPVTCKNVRA